MLSSHDLHPKQGARFVFTRVDDAPLTYQVEVFLPGTSRIDARLTWNENGSPAIDPAAPDAAVGDQLVKLARVLKRSAAPRLTRWRDIP
ncbi:MAG: hypothetical protein KUG77_16505 [Nannocystaceae bacterium]|nr:hypothetical protein [Nannocystaceae bacterium]